MLRPFWIMSAKSRVKTSRALPSDIDGYPSYFQAETHVVSLLEPRLAALNKRTRYGEVPY
jgi:hypothetical protein